MRPSFGLPVAGSPGTPFFPFFPFFSSLFVFCFGRRKWRIPEQLRRRGEAEPRATAASFSFFSFLSPFFFFFFFYFGRRKWRNPELLRRRGEAELLHRRGEAELLRRRSRLVGEEDNPTQNDVVLGWCDFFLKSKHPKTTSF